MELLFSIWSFSRDWQIKCKNCNATLKTNNISRIIISILITLPILFQKYLFNFGYNAIVLYLIYLLFVIVLSPLIVRYKLI
ncbi:hypothetical protein A500_16985 [Clostridium sartagoforme AAU1]|uniref:Cxxc_20_cxxc protein n=2 Tax=Clostridium sartagoforme TaxID=84031 RepID=R9BUS1_9CLOT|nr:hypothetical protein A500_16985 [Clostridium sartagoforme AAU1]